MPSIQKLAALAAFIIGVAADCSSDFVIESTTPNFPCKKMEGKVTVDPSVSGSLIIDGPTEFKKDFVVKNCTNLLSVSSPSLQAIGGEFIVQDGTLLGSINFPSLNNIDKFTLSRLPQLSTLKLSSDGLEVRTVDIEDTFLSDISDLNVERVDSMKMANNNKLSVMNMGIVNITKVLILVHNGNGMDVKLNSLESAYELQLSNIKSLSVPSLKEIQSGIKFDTNPNLESFEASNLTSVGTSKNGGSVSFINNGKLANVSFPILKTISGDMTIVNNTKLMEMAGFPELKSVSNMRLGGNFENVSLPKLDDVKGTINVQSTSNISDVCKFFNDLGNRVVQGKVNCKGNVDESTANNLNGTKGGKDDSAAASPSFSSAVIFLGLVAASVQLL